MGENVPKSLKRDIQVKLQNNTQVKRNIEQQGKRLIMMLQRHEEGIKSFFEALKLAKEEILLEQALVLSISAFEIFIKDSAIIMVNRNYMTHERFKDEITKRLDYSSLQTNNYNYTDSIGNLLWDEQTFYNVNYICSTFATILSIDRNEIFPSGENRKKMHRYIKLRHLIIHRNSIVDKQLFEETGIRTRIGLKYPINKKEVCDAVEVTTEGVNHIHDLITKSDLNTKQQSNSINL
jgi:hypothetical protein